MTPVREERRLVTSMFVDLVGSTELTMQLGAERLKVELGRAFGEISRIIAEHGGTVEKYIGDAIYALFGAPVAHEDDPLRALRAAEAIRGYCRDGQQHGHAFSVRIGIETGEAVVDLAAAATTRQQMSVGAVVNIAARLQQRADPGEILVGPTTRAAAAGAELEDLGDAELKGVGMLRIARLVRVGDARAQALPFVGRDAELALLAHAFDRMRRGRSVLAVVSGPPGQGKTRLVQEFLQRNAEGTHVIATRCRPADELGVFAPVRDILGVATLDQLAERVGRMCADDTECERVVGGLAESAGIATSHSLGGLGAAEREDEIVQAWRRYLGLVGRDALVVLAIDDIHWADASLVRLVDRITFGGPRVLVVATARPEFADSAGIRPSGDRFFIELEGLEPDEALRLAALAGRGNESVVERAEGNPLFLVELARAGHDGNDLPVTLQGALGARLDQLAPEDRALLSLAAVVGERFTAADAAFIAGRDPGEAGRALARLVDLHFLDVNERGYRFHHGLIREVAYGRLLAAERMRAHARFAQERVNPEYPAALAHHWWEALRPPDAEWVWSDDPRLGAMRRHAFEAHLAAGSRHGEHFAVDQATQLLTRALSFATDDTERARAERALGNANRAILRMDDAWEHLLRARALFAPAGVPMDLYADITNAAQYVGAFQRPPDPAEVQAIAHEGIAAARAAGDLRTASRIMRTLGGFIANTHPGEPEVADPYVEGSLELARESGDSETIRTAGAFRANVLRLEGRVRESLGVFGELEGLMADADQQERFNFQRFYGRSKFFAGLIDEAADDAARNDAIAESMGPHNRTHAWDDSCEIHFARGEWAPVIELAHRTARLVQEEKASAFCRSAGSILAGGAVAHALAGQRDEALALLRAMPSTNSVDKELLSGLALALLGFASPRTDDRLREKKQAWWEWADAAMRAVVLGRADAAEHALTQMGGVVRDSPIYAALAGGVSEVAAELRGGPPAKLEGLRKLGLNGWADILERRVDAEY